MMPHEFWTDDFSTAVHWLRSKDEGKRMALAATPATRGAKKQAPKVSAAKREKKATRQEVAFCVLVPEKGVEPSTFSLRMSCSTN